VRAKVPAISESLSKDVTRVIHEVRKLNMAKVPGVAETIDWATALVALRTQHLNQDVITETTSCFLKDEGDLRKFEAELSNDRITEILNPVP
jgi:MoxR-like ATPase